MAIVKKGSRKIVVDGIEYRWRIRQKPTINQIDNFVDGWEGIAASVEQAVEKPGAILVIGWGQNRTNTTELISITPSMIADAIRRAVQEGWQPLSPGKPFEQWNPYH